MYNNDSIINPEDSFQEVINRIDRLQAEYSEIVDHVDPTSKYERARALEELTKNINDYFDAFERDYFEPRTTTSQISSIDSLILRNKESNILNNYGSYSPGIENTVVAESQAQASGKTYPLLSKPEPQSTPSTSSKGTSTDFSAPFLAYINSYPNTQPFHLKDPPPPKLRVTKRSRSSLISASKLKSSNSISKSHVVTVSKASTSNKKENTKSFWKRKLPIGPSPLSNVINYDD